MVKVCGNLIHLYSEQEYLTLINDVIKDPMPIGYSIVNNQANILIFRKQSLHKTIKIHHKENNKIINEEAKILNEIKTFYQTLFDSYDQKLTYMTLNDYIRKYRVNKIMSEQSQTLEGELSELGNALTCMKNSKIPGINGFPEGFSKVF